jgi:hypothetical protein
MSGYRLLCHAAKMRNETDRPNAVAAPAMKEIQSIIVVTLVELPILVLAGSANAVGVCDSQKAHDSNAKNTKEPAHFGGSGRGIQ